ncbi:MAG: hypothetical protein LAT51_04365 [Flavobacteriaceae bacterium]|nr:hypothetical protein [Flavobacteriaceae bacterium]
MNRFTLLLFLIGLVLLSCDDSNKVVVNESEHGFQLQVNGDDFFINGMNWDYFPIGTNYDYSLWNQSEDIIQKALDYEMQLLQDMGVNAIRVYTGIPPKWITYIYQNYGIYTMLNHSFGRYGLQLNNEWVAETNYADPSTQKLLLAEVEEMANTYKNTPGLLLYLIGNENNYGLFWQGAETEDIPNEQTQIEEVGENQARPMYALMNQASKKIKKNDKNVPIAICNGDLLYLDIIKQECNDVDIFGTNIYRGKSFGDTYQKIKQTWNKPVLFTEFGADAYNAILDQEDQVAQAYFLIHNWKEIYSNAAGLGKAENSIGGFTFQFSDGWWKHGQTYNLDIQDTTASWVNGGYYLDYQDGENNMNEEWFGLCAKEKPNEEGLYQLRPRLAYKKLQQMHQINPYQMPLEEIEKISDSLLKIIQPEVEQIKLKIKK